MRILCVHEENLNNFNNAVHSQASNKHFFEFFMSLKIEVNGNEKQFGNLHYSKYLLSRFTQESNEIHTSVERHEGRN